MKLKDLFYQLNAGIEGDANADITAVTLDSRTVVKGSLFAALVNPLRNNENFIADALTRGASAILASRPVETNGVPLVVAPKAADVLGLAAHRLFGDPTQNMTLVGVTGTNGKTTFCFLMESVFKRAGQKTGVIGTISHRFDGHEIAAKNTTPEAPDLAELFAKMRDAGVTAAVMETSSHGLALSRVAGCRFRAGVFTNLSRDHMDFHRDEDEYLDAKRRLFSEYLDTDHPEESISVINADDEKAAWFINCTRARVVTYGRSEFANYRIASATADGTGIAIDVRSPNGNLNIRSPLLGHFQIYNVLAAVATAIELGIPEDIVLDAVADVRGVPGRMEKVPGDVLVIVDYAHTPDALANLVAAGRKLARGRLITLFGCGGDRDKGKRPLMAQAAASASDVLVVTSDNPRTEVPAAIIEDVLTGLNLSQWDWLAPAELGAYRGNKGLVVEEDRKKAIALAITGASKDDVVLIAGKGHEDYQIRGREKIHFDDREEAAAALASRNGDAGAAGLHS